MIDGMGHGVDKIIAYMMVICMICVPLGLWKAIEIMMWIISKISINV